MLALLDLVGEELEEFETLANQERLIASLEAAGNTISDEMFEFWSQNKNRKVEFRLRLADELLTGAARVQQPDGAHPQRAPPRLGYL